MSFDDRQMKRIALPPTDIEQEAFDLWRSSYEALVERGQARGWLLEDADGVQYVNKPRPSGYHERLETDEEYHDRTQGPFSGAARLMHEYADTRARNTQSWIDFITAQTPSVDGYVTFPVRSRREDGEALTYDQYIEGTE